MTYSNAFEFSRTPNCGYNKIKKEYSIEKWVFKLKKSALLIMRELLSNCWRLFEIITRGYWTNIDKIDYVIDWIEYNYSTNIK